MTSGGSDLRTTGTPEFELLLESAKPPSESDAAGWAGPAGEIDWTLLLDRAVEHAMVPLVRRRLDAAGWVGVPDTVRTWLDERHEENRRRNRLLTIELLALLDRLGAAGIEAIPFKGPVAAHTCYGDLDARPFGDIDLLVAPSDVRGAMDVMARSGYEPLIPLSTTQRAAFLRHRTEYPLQRPARGGIVDLHWELFHRQFSFPLVPDRTRMRAVRLAGQPVRTMGTEDQLLMLCAHATKHLWVRLEWIAAVAWLVARTEDLDWELAEERARSLGGRRMLGLGLALAGELLDARFARAPELRGPIDSGVAALGAEVVARLQDGSPPPADWWRFYLRARERRRDQAAILVRTAVIPTIGDWRMLDLPHALTGLHYALRPIRLLGRGVRALRPGGGND
ncbi:MAG: nucleotidyltransferase domain-containing protein [Gemmatimonadota bacterium]